MKRFILILTSLFVMFGVDGLSSADIASKAKYLGFDGDYIGANDPLLSFDGNGNWFSGLMRSFTLTINNNTTDNQKVVLFPGYVRNNVKIDSIIDCSLNPPKTDTTADFSGCTYNDATHTLSLASTKNFGEDFLLKILNLTKTTSANNDLVAYDGIIFTSEDKKTVVCQGSPSEIKNLVAYLMNHPTWLQSMKLRASDASQLQQSISLTELNPFNGEKTHVIPLTKFTTNKDFQNNLIDIEVGMTIGDQTVMSIDVVPGKLDITFMFGVSINTAKYLDFSAEKASETATLYGREQVKRNVAVEMPKIQ